VDDTVAARGRGIAVPEERQNGPDEADDEMPDTGGAPCGDIFGTPATTYVTDADADVITSDQGD
jgi:hypothetical protein